MMATFFGEKQKEKINLNQQIYRLLKRAQKKNCFN